MSTIDNDAATALKPLIQGLTAAVLSAEAQSAVSIWIFKSALIFDALQAGEHGQVATPGYTVMLGRINAIISGPARTHHPDSGVAL